MIIGYLHIALMHDDAGPLIAADMHGRILASGLYEASDAINLVFIGDDEKAYNLYQVLFRHHSKYIVRRVSVNLMEWEWATLRIMQQDAIGMSNAYVWYAHTKGASHFNDKVCERIQTNVNEWRSRMCHDMFNRHKEARDMLVDHVAVGPYYISGPERYHGNTLAAGRVIPRHFSGNYWWSTTSYIAHLPLITNEMAKDRVESEMWIGRGFGDLGALSTCEHSTDLYDIENAYGDEGPLSSGSSGLSG